MSIQIQDAGSNPIDLTSGITYQSRATRSLSAADLRELSSAARRRNRSLGVTGMLLYDKGRFFQTLEGPPASLKVLWESISSDPRHSEIEILSEHVIPARLFGSWDLLSYHRDEGAVSNFPKARADHDVSRRIPDLIDLVLAGDDIGINRMMASLAEDGWDGDTILAHLIEPTARTLGDAWLSDECSELDLTIGLSMLQLAGHAVRSTPSHEMLRNSRYSILLATAPGEAHALGTSLLVDLFIDAGWQVDMTFPESDQALANQLAAQQPDAVDIALSESLRREHKLAKLRETVERSRFAAPDNLTVVSVGGRVFADAAATASSVGADHARKTVVGTTVRIAALIQQKRQQHGSS